MTKAVNYHIDEDIYPLTCDKIRSMFPNVKRGDVVTIANKADVYYYDNDVMIRRRTILSVPSVFKGIAEFHPNHWSELGVYFVSLSINELGTWRRIEYGSICCYRVEHKSDTYLLLAPTWMDIDLSKMDSLWVRPMNRIIHAWMMDIVVNEGVSVDNVIIY